MTKCCVCENTATHYCTVCEDIFCERHAKIHKEVFGISVLLEIGEKPNAKTD
jgi:hypothetical protein